MSINKVKYSHFITYHRIQSATAASPQPIFKQKRKVHITFTLYHISKDSIGYCGLTSTYFQKEEKYMYSIHTLITLYYHISQDSTGLCGLYPPQRRPHLNLHRLIVHARHIFHRTFFLKNCTTIGNITNHVFQVNPEKNLPKS